MFTDGCCVCFRFRLGVSRLVSELEASTHCLLSAWWHWGLGPTAKGASLARQFIKNTGSRLLTFLCGFRSHRSRRRAQLGYLYIELLIKHSITQNSRHRGTARAGRCDLIIYLSVAPTRAIGLIIFSFSIPPGSGRSGTRHVRVYTCK